MRGDAETPHLIPNQLYKSSLYLHRSSAVDHFPVGSAVEVRTDEQDFTGVYFTATVISPTSLESPKKSRRKSPKFSTLKDSTRLDVEYHDLLADENGSDRLRESVDISFLRPVPPSQEIGKGFEPGDVVDAFYKDGWWLGVVSRVVEGGERYVVTFQNPPDVLEFGLPELRLHFDWVNGTWVRPQKQSIAGLMFDVGRKVEVSFDREDSQDAWFPATIQDDLGNGAFRVHYMDNKGVARETTVDSLHVRPCPPLLKDKNFSLLEKVDAFFDFCWWSGVITKELEDCRYVVFFKQMKQDKKITQSEIRPHMEWKEGKWFTSSQQQKLLQEEGGRRALTILSLLCMWLKEGPIHSLDEGVHEHRTSENTSASPSTAPAKNSIAEKDTCDGRAPTSLASTKGHFEQSTPDNQKMPRAITSVKKRKQYLTDSGTILCQSSKKLKEGNVLLNKHQDRLDGHGPTKGFVCGFVSPDSVGNMETSTPTSEDQPSIDTSWDKQRKDREVWSKQNSTEKIDTSSSVMSSTKLLFESLFDAAIDDEPDAAGNPEEDAQNEHVKEGSELPIIVGLPCIETGSPGFGSSGGRKSKPFKIKEIVTNLNDKEPQHIISSIPKVKDNTQPETEEFTERRKRGRPKKTLVESTQYTVSGNTQNGIIGSGDLVRKADDLLKSPQVEVNGMEALIPSQENIEVHKEKVADVQSDPNNRKVRTKRATPSVYKDIGVKESSELGENRSLKKRGRKQTAVQVQDSLVASGGTMMEVEDRVAKLPSTEFDNEPLSKWIVEINSPPLIDSSRRSPESILEQCRANGEKQTEAFVIDEASRTQVESGRQLCSSVDKESTVSREPQRLAIVGDKSGAVLDKNSLPDALSLPFVKNEGLWRTIESMEVFQKIPQKPHFQPLEQVKERSYREGLAIGLMVTFASLVERTSKLQAEDPKSSVDDIIGTMQDLDKHGFDVEALHVRLSQFLQAKEKEEKLVEEVNNINKEILERHNEVSRFEGELREIKEQIRRLQEKHSVTSSAKDRVVDEATSLQDQLKKSEEMLDSLRLDFKIESFW